MSQPVREAVPIPRIFDDRSSRDIHTRCCPIRLECPSRSRLRIEYDIPHLEFLRAKFGVLVVSMLVVVVVAVVMVSSAQPRSF